MGIMEFTHFDNGLLGDWMSKGYHSQCVCIDYLAEWGVLFDSELA